MDSIVSDPRLMSRNCSVAKQETNGTIRTLDVDFQLFSTRKLLDRKSGWRNGPCVEDSDVHVDFGLCCLFPTTELLASVWSLTPAVFLPTCYSSFLSWWQLLRHQAHRQLFPVLLLMRHRSELQPSGLSSRAKGGVPHLDKFKKQC